MNEATVRFIGVLQSDITNLANAPKIYTESSRTGTLEIYPKYEDVLAGAITSKFLSSTESVIFCIFIQ